MLCADRTRTRPSRRGIYNRAALNCGLAPQRRLEKLFYAKRHCGALQPTLITTQASRRVVSPEHPQGAWTEAVAARRPSCAAPCPSLRPASAADRQRRYPRRPSYGLGSDGRVGALTQSPIKSTAVAAARRSRAGNSRGVMHRHGKPRGTGVPEAASAAGWWLVRALAAATTASSWICASHAARRTASAS